METILTVRHPCQHLILHGPIGSCKRNPNFLRQTNILDFYPRFSMRSTHKNKHFKTINHSNKYPIITRNANQIDKFCIHKSQNLLSDSKLNSTIIHYNYLASDC